MRVRIIVLGRLKSGPERQLADRYFDRLDKAGRGLGFGPAVLTEIPESRAGSADLRRDQEADAIRRAAAGNPVGFLFDERGVDVSSEEFAAALDRARTAAAGDAVLAVGGPDGLAGGLRSEAAMVLRLGRMTWPHQLARIMVCEQVYRAMTILSGHPYHRGG